MLAYIKGTLEEMQDDAVIIDHQGLGFRVFTSSIDLANMPPIGQMVKMHLYMNVREDDVSLFGFLEKDALRLFRLLISVSGVGPKVALAVLSALSVNDLQMAIISGDVKALTKANGVGTKGAQRMIVELKDKVNVDSMLDNNTESFDNTGLGTDVVAATAMALTSLGYSQMEAMQAIRKVEHTDTMNEEALLKAALRKLV